MAKNASLFVKMAAVLSLFLMLVVLSESRFTLIGKSFSFQFFKVGDTKILRTFSSFNLYIDTWMNVLINGIVNTQMVLVSRRQNQPLCAAKLSVLKLAMIAPSLAKSLG